MTDTDYRSRLVAKEFKRGDKRELFAGTPPLEALKVLISDAATIDQDCNEEKKLMINDVKRAYFYAAATRPVYKEIPAEDLEPGDEMRVGELQLSMYGTREAAIN